MSAPKGIGPGGMFSLVVRPIVGSVEPESVLTWVERAQQFEYMPISVMMEHRVSEMISTIEYDITAARGVGTQDQHQALHMLRQYAMQISSAQEQARECRCTRPW
jgi:hypothetical protein